MATYQIYKNPTSSFLIDQALAWKEAVLAANGALAVQTGMRTGRSPKDRFIVKDALTQDTVDWGVVNQPMPSEVFDKIYDKVLNYLAQSDYFISDVQVGADPAYALPVEMITEKAWQHLFGRNLFILRGEHSVAANRPQWQLINVPGLMLDPASDGTHSEGLVVLNFTRKIVLLCGMHYAGEMKTAMFSVMNFLMPDEDVLPMHCGANVGEAGDVALFFGLSGTGKTTLSAEPSRYLLGDDEHGWSKDGVFNFEGGCYAKCIDLSKEREPIIWDAIRSGSIMENVVLNPETLQPDYTNTSLTQNTRAAYPLDFVEKRIIKNHAALPSVVIFLTCDLFGVLPPVAKLTREQAAYYFLSGYTALVGSTEMGAGTGIKTTFSTCFGAPFFSRPAQVYADLLIKKVAENNVTVYLVNTGWYGGGFGAGGQRFSIPTTRAVVNSIIDGHLANSTFSILPWFNLQIPDVLLGVDSKLLDPRKTWAAAEQYASNAKTLIDQFKENFKRFAVCDEIAAAGPDY